MDLLAEGGNNKVIALNKERVAKLFPLDEQDWAIKEYEMLHIAQSINSLYPKVCGIKRVRQEYWVVMERLPVLSIRSFSKQEREGMLVQFHLEWAELHNVLASWDIARMTDLPGDKWDNIIPSISNGVPCIRMIDMGNGKLKGHRKFERAVCDDLRDIEEYSRYFLNI